MKHLSVRTAVYAILDIALLAACLLHIPSLLGRASPPFILEEHDGTIVVGEIRDASASHDIRRGTRITRWNGHSVRDPLVVEFLTDFESIGSIAQVSYLQNGTPADTHVELIHTYPISHVISFLLITLITWCLAVYVVFKGPRERTTDVVHWAMLSMAVVVMMAWEGGSATNSLGYVDSVLFLVAYLGVATAFFFFTSMFPRPKWGSVRLKAILTFVPAVLLLVLIFYHHGRATFLQSTEEFLTFRGYYTFLHASLFIYIGGGLLNFIHSYVTATTSEERKKLKWMLWGLCIGPTPFLLFTILPDLIAPEYSVSDAVSLLPLVAIPVSFAVSIVKYRLFDVEVVINRTTVYGIVVGVLVVVYVLTIGTVANIVGRLTVEISTVAAVVVALLFEPVRVKAQRFVDKRFFRVHYNYRAAERRFLEDIKHCIDLNTLAHLIIRQTEEVIPVERIGFFVLHQPGDRLHTLAQRGFDLFESRSIRFQIENIKTRMEQPIALDDRLEPGIMHESADRRVFQRWGMALVFPMLSEQFEFLGFLVLGPKKSGTRFTAEDVDLLSNVATQAGLSIQRITLVHELVLKGAETQRLQELNQLKSDFVSYVSHELRTPLTSVKMFTELLRCDKKLARGKPAEYLEIIEGEADRLARMVTTILDSARIDKGVTQYELRNTDLRTIAGRAVATMRYQLEQHGFTVVYKPPKRPLGVNADPDAVGQAITNLIANAIKYSGQRKFLRVSLLRGNGQIHCRIDDRGLGISAESLPHLFEKFYRDPVHSNHTQGVGLGLPLVKHIMDAHGGNIEVHSTIGKGSRFCLCFPALKEENGQAKTNPRS